ncbi:MAG: beta-N-acetylhexosaminidase [Gammaproteobacteria bacterium]|nr:beta-N-acetylhexosaminidase [Gammaproteobacteria bacterium]
MLNFSSAGKRLMIGFPGQTPADSAVKTVLHHIKTGIVGGVILFSYNIESPKQLKELTHALKKANPDLWIAIDQEGGKVQRLNKACGFEEFPSCQYVSGQYDEREAYELYYRMAKTLKEFGITINFAPVVDLKNESCPIGAYERSFSENPEQVVRYASAFIKAHKQAGVLTTLKHFPGLGFARGDTHAGLVDITESFQPEEWIPFKNLIGEGMADLIMVGHVMMRKWDPFLPATLSPNIISRLLKSDLQFRGLVVADDLQMGALAQNFSLEERVVKAIHAGCDLLLFSNNPLANKSALADWTYDPDLPVKVAEIIKKKLAPIA